MTEATATDIALTVDGIWSKRGLISAYLLMCDSLAGAGGGGGWVGDNRAKRGGCGSVVDSAFSLTIAENVSRE